MTTWFEALGSFGLRAQPKGAKVKAKGPIMLLITAFLWGMAFVAQSQAADAVQPFTFNASRNFVGVLFLTLVIYARGRMGQDVPASKQVSAVSKTPCLGSYSRRMLLVGGAACGIVLCASSYLQQLGITAYPADAAASGRSGFVTATYMIMVAVFAIFAGKTAHPIVFVAVAVAMVGMYLLCAPNGFDNIYWGDALVLVSAVGYALHIIVIDRYTHIDGVRLSRVQLLVAGSVSLVCALMLEHPEPSQVMAALLPILYAGIFSDGVAYTLQIVAQQTTDPTVAAILMSLESVFAALGGWVILGEQLGAVELCGCALVFVAVMMAQVPDFMENARKKSLEFKG